MFSCSSPNIFTVFVRVGEINPPTQRYLILEKMEKQRMIFNLEIHPQFPLIVNGTKIGRYTADFKYKTRKGETIIEDVKSKITKTRDYILRKKILSTYNPPIVITEIL